MLTINKETPESELHPGVLAVTELWYGGVSVWTNKHGMRESLEVEDVNA